MWQGKGKVVWITGASYGLGKALALQMARQGWQVVASARTLAGLEAVRDEAQGLKGRVHPVPCDITDLASVGKAVADIAVLVGLVDVAVLNAGTHLAVRADTLRAEDFRKLTDVNLIGTANCLEKILPQMRDAGQGQIAVVASVAGFRGMPTSSAYGMTKAGLINMCEALKPELDLLGVKIQVICPGFIRTPLTDKNDFPMPFLMEPEAAARAFCRGLRSRRFEIVFPWQMSMIMNLLRILPAPLAFAITRRMIPDDPNKEENV